MTSNQLPVRAKEACYRHGKLIEDKKEPQRSPIAKDGTKVDVKSPTKGNQPEKIVAHFKPKPQEHFLEETVEDLLDEDEKFPVIIKVEDKKRTEPPTYDKEPVKAFVAEQKPKETKVQPEPRRKVSQENILNQECRQPMGMVKSDKDIMKASVMSEKARGRESTPNLKEREKPVSASEIPENGSFGMYGKFLGSSTNGMTEVELLAENKLLRHFLRDINDILNQQMEKVKVEEDNDWKKVEFKNKSPEEKIKTIVREIANNEKILAISKEEHRKAEARTSVLKDPVYLEHMQDEIDFIQTKVEEIKRENKQLRLANGNVGKDLDLIENVKGVPQSIEETREKQLEMKMIMRKLEGLRQKNAASAEEKKYKIEKQKALTSEIEKLERVSESLGPLEPGSRMSRLEYLRMMAEEALKKTRKKCKGKKIVVEREIDTVSLQNQREREHIERLDEIIKEQTAALKGMITSERQKSNKSTQELLDNMRLSLEPDERKMYGSSNQIDDDRLEAFKVAPNRPLKTKSIERGGGRMINRDLFDTYDIRKIHQSFSKHKPVIRRELIGEKKSGWKETVEGDRARMEQLVSLSPTKKREPHEIETFSKPLGPKKFFGAATSAKNSGEEVGERSGLSRNQVNSLSVKRIDSKGLAESKPFAYDMRQKARHFDSKDWQDNLNGDNGLGNSGVEETARTKLARKKEEEAAKSSKVLDIVKRKSQIDEEMGDGSKGKGKGRMNEGHSEDYSIKKGSGELYSKANHQSSVDLKRVGQPDNSQGRSNMSPTKKVGDLKAIGVKKGKKKVQEDFEEIEFND